MKKVLCGLLAGVMCLSLAACSGGGAKEKTPFDPAETVQALLDAQVFSEELEELDPVLLFGLSGAEEDYEGSVLYYSTGATAETAAVISVADGEKAKAVEAELSAWVDSQIEAESSYRPAEAEKLEHAILETRGATVLLVVAADWEKANTVIAE